MQFRSFLRVETVVRVRVVCNSLVLSRSYIAPFRGYGAGAAGESNPGTPTAYRLSSILTATGSECIIC